MALLIHRFTIPLLAVLTLLVMRVFVVFPQLDLVLSGLAHGPSGFVIDQTGIIEAARNTLWNLSFAMFVAAIIALAMGYTARWPHRVLPIRLWSVIFWGFLLGPGILVNALLKAFSGRVRPINVQEFGGSQLFTAVGDWSGQCNVNCSFVSGEVSGITALCISGIILVQYHASRLPPKVQRTIYNALALSFGFMFLHRILSGGHFTSDALLAALLTGLVFAIVARVLPHVPQTPHLGG